MFRQTQAVRVILIAVDSKVRDPTRPTSALIAQDVESIFPGLVPTDANGYKSGAYGAFTRLSSMP